MPSTNSIFWAGVIVMVAGALGGAGIVSFFGFLLITEALWRK